MSLLQRVKYTHQAKTGSSWIPSDIKYSSISIGIDYFRYFRDIQLMVPSFHFTWNFHPAVVCRLEQLPRLETIHLDFFSTARLSFGCYRILSMIWRWYPSALTWFNIFSAIIFANYGFTAPSGNSTSYRMVLSTGILLWFPITFPSESTLCWINLASCKYPPLVSNTSSFIRMSAVDIGWIGVPSSSTMSDSGNLGATSS